MNFKPNQLKGTIRKVHANVKHVIMSSTRGPGVKVTLTSMVVSGECFFTESLWFERASEITLDTL